jgi:GNAT superfamily N-acetyltransferase
MEKTPMPSDILVRQATLEDAAVLALLLSELNQVVGAMGWPEPQCFAPENAIVTAEAMRARLVRAQGIETVFVAEAGAEPAGFTALRLVPYLDQDSPYAEVTQMYVVADYRRRGVGAALIEAAESRAREAGATCVHIMTGLDNSHARAFYAAAGYAETCVMVERWFETAKT